MVWYYSGNRPKNLSYDSRDGEPNCCIENEIAISGRPRIILKRSDALNVHFVVSDYLCIAAKYTIYVQLLPSLFLDVAVLQSLLKSSMTNR